MQLRKNDLTSKAKYRVNYTTDQLNCGNCLYSTNDWVGDNGKCTVFGGVIFDIIRTGICRLHSKFGHGSREW